LPQKINNEFRAVNFTTKNPPATTTLVVPNVFDAARKGCDGGRFPMFDLSKRVLPRNVCLLAPPKCFIIYWQLPIEAE